MPDKAIEFMRDLQEQRRARMHTPANKIPTNARTPHYAEAVHESRPLEQHELRWQRVLEIVAWRAPYVDVYLRGSRLVYADARDAHFEVLSDIAVRVLSYSPEIDIVHEAIREVTGKRLMPVAHRSSRSFSDHEREEFERDMERAESVVREAFTSVEVME